MTRAAFDASAQTAIAAAKAGFAASPNGFIVKGLNVSPAGMTPAAGGYGRGDGGLPGEGFAPPVAPVPVPGRGGLPGFLNEQLLRVTLEVVIVKPLPKN